MTPAERAQWSDRRMHSQNIPNDAVEITNTGLNSSNSEWCESLHGASPGHSQEEMAVR